MKWTQILFARSVLKAGGVAVWRPSFESVSPRRTREVLMLKKQFGNRGQYR